LKLVTKGKKVQGGQRQQKVVLGGLGEGFAQGFPGKRRKTSSIEKEGRGGVEVSRRIATMGGGNHSTSCVKETKTTDVTRTKN